MTVQSSVRPWPRTCVLDGRGCDCHLGAIRCWRGPGRGHAGSRRDPRNPCRPRARAYPAQRRRQNRARWRRHRNRRRQLRRRCGELDAKWPDDPRRRRARPPAGSRSPRRGQGDLGDQGRQHHDRERGVLRRRRGRRQRRRHPPGGRRAHRSQLVFPPQPERHPHGPRTRRATSSSSTPSSPTTGRATARRTTSTSAR